LTLGIWVILLNLVHTGNLQFLAITCSLTANENGFLTKTSKTLRTVTKNSVQLNK